MKRYILWLNAVGDEEIVRVGPKAANLARLCGRGFPVPDAFCITTEAFHDCLSSLHSVNPDNVPYPSPETLSGALLSTPVPLGLESQISEAYRLLTLGHGPEVRVAVRSSASSEDLPEASFAGQYLSVLNVADEEELLQAIKQCWCSSYSPQIQAYQSRYRAGREHSGMAVIVQLMVHAEMAGVLFTINPSGEDRKHLVIEATTGLGDRIVAGTETGIRLTADRDTLKITNVLTSAQGIDIKLIERADWTPLLKLSLQIEDLMNAPQDVEWSFTNQQFWILQSRPITAMRSAVPRQTWTRANIGEILPGVVTPLTWSVFKPTLTSAGFHKGKSLLTLHWKWHHPGGVWPDSPRLFCGRAYMELAGVYASFCSLPGVDKDILQRLLGFEFNAGREGEIPVRKPRWHIMDPVRYSLYWIEMLGITENLSRKVKWWESQKISFECTGSDGTADIPKTALRQIDQLLKEGAETLGLHIQCTSMAFSAFGLIHNLIRKNVGTKEAQEFEIRMMGDFHDMTTAEQGIAIWDLAQAAARESRVEETLFKHQTTDEIIKIWRGCPDANTFLKLWDAFQSRFGHRGTEEFELAVPHWNEDPSIIFQMMREIINHRLPDPRERLHRQQEATLRDTRSMIDRIDSKGSYWETVLFRRLIDVYYSMVQLRENMKYCVVSRFNALRKMFVVLGDILKYRGLISSGNDIFFLTYNEIADLIENHPGSSFDAVSLVADRRTTYEEHTKVLPPDMWILSEGREIPLSLFAQQDSTVLRGIGCSAGLITGRASVLTSVQGNVTTEQGRILVAPSIDPGLTPLFLSAIGVVTEIGGILSHGATVAREYGLPAVVGVPHATKIIQNGQQITIDGSAGLVYLGPTTGQAKMDNNQ